MEFITFINFHQKLDHSFELMLKEKSPITKEKFRETIFASEPTHIRDAEVDYLFQLLDYSNNNEIDKHDFRDNTFE